MKIYLAEAWSFPVDRVPNWPDGTSISVKNLFFNVPARRNFLKSNAVEMRHILDEFQHDFGIRFRVVKPDQPEISLPGEEVQVFEIPEDWTANVSFGGADRRTLFITASKGLYAVRLRVKGANSAK